MKDILHSKFTVDYSLLTVFKNNWIVKVHHEERKLDLLIQLLTPLGKIYIKFIGKVHVTRLLKFPDCKISLSFMDCKNETVEVKVF